MSVGRMGSGTERHYVVQGGKWVNAEILAERAFDRAAGSERPAEGLSGLSDRGLERAREAVRAPGSGRVAKASELAQGVDFRGGVFGGPYGADALRSLDDPSSGLKAFAGVDPVGGRSFTIAAIDRRDGSIGSAVTSAVAKDGTSTVAAMGRMRTDSGMAVTGLAAAPADGAVRLAADGRLALEPASAKLGATVRQASTARDGLFSGLERGGLSDGSATLSRQLGEKPAASVEFAGHDRNGFMVRGGMSVENGAAKMSVMSEDGKRTVWSRTVRDPGFSVGADGAVKMQGRAAEMAEGFLADPKGEARRREGMAPDPGLTRAFVDAPASALDGIDAPGVPRAKARGERSGLGR